MKKYSWIFEEGSEVWHGSTCDTIEECLAAAREQNKEDGEQYAVVFIGENVLFVPSVSVLSIFHEIEEDAIDMCGEIGDDWEPSSDTTKDAKNELKVALNEVLHNWLKKYGCYPDFYAVRNVQKYDLASGTKLDS